MRPSASVLTHLAAFAFRPTLHHHLRYPGTPTVLSLEPLCLGLLSGNSTSISPHVRLVEPCLWPIRTETPRIGSHSQVPCANDVIFRPTPTRLTFCVRSICALHLDTSDSERPLTDTQSAVHTASDRAECKCTPPAVRRGSRSTDSELTSSPSRPEGPGPCLHGPGHSGPATASASQAGGRWHSLPPGHHASRGLTSR